MSLFNSIAGQVAGAVGQQLGGQTQGADASQVMQALGSLLNDPTSGGVSGLVDSFKSQGLGQLLESWTGSGAKLPISADQVQQVFNSQQLASVASHLGLPAGQIPALIAQYLPQIMGMLMSNGGGSALGQLGNLAGMLRK